MRSFSLYCSSYGKAKKFHFSEEKMILIPQQAAVLSLFGMTYFIKKLAFIGKNKIFNLLLGVNKCLQHPGDQTGFLMAYWTLLAIKVIQDDFKNTKYILKILRRNKVFSFPSHPCLYNTQPHAHKTQDRLLVHLEQAGFIIFIQQNARTNLSALGFHQVRLMKLQKPSTTWAHDPPASKVHVCFRRTVHPPGGCGSATDRLTSVRSPAAGVGLVAQPMVGGRSRAHQCALEVSPCSRAGPSLVEGQVTLFGQANTERMCAALPTT